MEDDKFVYAGEPAAGPLLPDYSDHCCRATAASFSLIFPTESVAKYIEKMSKRKTACKEKGIMET